MTRIAQTIDGIAPGIDLFVGDQLFFIASVWTPETEIMRVFPGDAYNGIIFIGRMAEIVFNHRFVICQLASPGERIGQSGFADSLVLIGVKSDVEPVQVLTIVD